MKILIAAGIYPPTLGGPATFAKNLFEALKKEGHSVSVLTFCQGEKEEEAGVIYLKKSGIKFLRYVAYFRNLLRFSKEADIIYAFDLISVGLPCALLKLIRPKIKLVYRLGGDFQWEAALQKEYFDGTVWQYWEKKKFGLYENIIYRLTNFSLEKADLIVFNANLIRDVFLKYRGVPESKAAVVKNIAPRTELLNRSENHHGNFIRIVFFGRLIAMKNLRRLVRAFEKVLQNGNFKSRVSLFLAGQGPELKKIESLIKEKKLESFVSIGKEMSREQVLEELKKSQIMANVSLTEVNAHFVAEALALRIPVVLTEQSEQFYTRQKSDLIYYVDPLNTDDMAQKIIQAINNLDSRNQFEIGDIFQFAWPAEKVAAEHIKIFSKIV